MFFDRIHNIEGSDNMYQAGLVLEGGGMKGVYSSNNHYLVLELLLSLFQKVA